MLMNLIMEPHRIRQTLAYRLSFLGLPSSVINAVFYSQSYKQKDSIGKDNLSLLSFYLFFWEVYRTRLSYTGVVTCRRVAQDQAR